MRNLKIIAALALGFLAACGTSDVKETLGLNHRAPDEFRVYERPPLSVPPEFSLHPPEKGSETMSGVPADEQARSKVLDATGATALPAAAASGVANVPAAPGASHFLVAPAANVPATAVSPVTANELPTSADSQFLANAGATKADPHVRDELDQESGVAATEKKGPYFFGNKKEGDSLVDPTKEADRLKQDKAQDKPPTTGDTPVVPQKNSGWLGDIF